MNEHNSTTDLIKENTRKSIAEVYKKGTGAYPKLLLVKSIITLMWMQWNIKDFNKNKRKKELRRSLKREKSNKLLSHQ